MLSAFILSVSAHRSSIYTSDLDRQFVLQVGNSASEGTSSEQHKLLTPRVIPPLPRRVRETCISQGKGLVFKRVNKNAEALIFGMPSCYHLAG